MDKCLLGEQKVNLKGPTAFMLVTKEYMYCASGGGSRKDQEDEWMRMRVRGKGDQRSGNKKAPTWKEIRQWCRHMGPLLFS